MTVHPASVLDIFDRPPDPTPYARALRSRPSLEVVRGCMTKRAITAPAPRSLPFTRPADRRRAAAMTEFECIVREVMGDSADAFLEHEGWAS